MDFFKVNNIILKARKLFIIPGFLLILFLTACGADKDKIVTPGCYYWKTNLSIGQYEQQVLKGINAQHLYIRMFDVDWQSDATQAAPVALLQAQRITDTTLQYIPVVYITQRCLTKMKPEEVPDMAVNISKLIHQLCQKYGMNYKEVQLDCDWTKNSAALYFSLLRAIKQQPVFKGKKLSCTIRMHQVKYRSSSGIPPVDRGLLMVYNMGNLTRYGKHNSILELTEAKDYLTNLATYPLELDIALPLFYWSALFEQSKFKGIVYNVGVEDFDLSKLKKLGGSLYQFSADTKAKGYSFLAGQTIRFEAPSTNDILNIANYISRRMNAKTYKVSLYHLDSMAMQHFSIAEMKEIMEVF